MAEVECGAHADDAFGCECALGLVSICALTSTIARILGQCEAKRCTRRVRWRRQCHIGACAFADDFRLEALPVAALRRRRGRIAVGCPFVTVAVGRRQQPCCDQVNSIRSHLPQCRIQSLRVDERPALLIANRHTNAACSACGHVVALILPK